jgi:hypothetical protein
LGSASMTSGGAWRSAASSSSLTGYTSIGWKTCSSKMHGQTQGLSISFQIRVTFGHHGNLTQGAWGLAAMCLRCTRASTATSALQRCFCPPLWEPARQIYKHSLLKPICPTHDDLWHMHLFLAQYLASTINDSVECWHGGTRQPRRVGPSPPAVER